MPLLERSRLGAEGKFTATQNTVIQLNSEVVG